MELIQSRDGRYSYINCERCETSHTVAWTEGGSCTREIKTILAQSWRPITLECTCGARCTILNGRICE